MFIVKTLFYTKKYEQIITKSSLTKIRRKKSYIVFFY